MKKHVKLQLNKDTLVQLSNVQTRFVAGGEAFIGPTDLIRETAVCYSSAFIDKCPKNTSDGVGRCIGPAPSALCPPTDQGITQHPAIG